MNKLILTLSLVASLWSAPIQYGSVIVSKVVSVYDGDTFKADIEHYPDLIGKNINIRVNGVDTPEIRGKCQLEKDLAYRARDLTKTFLERADIVVLYNMKRGKYFRIVADVNADGYELSKLLIDSGLAVPYDGGTKIKDWCKE